MNLSIRSKRRTNEIRQGSVIPDMIIGIVLLAVAFVCIIPLWHCLMASLSDGRRLLAHSGLVVLPVGEATLDGYRLIFRDSSILRGYANTLLYVFGQSALGFVINVVGGYILSRKTRLQRVLTAFLIFTMMFSGGTVPVYMVIRKLGMTGTIWSLIVPGCTNAMFVVMMATAFRQVPEAVHESARLDGAGNVTIMFRIMLPQSLGFALVTLINTALLAWNSWFEASIYVTNQQNLWPLQLWIRQLTSQNVDFLNYNNPDYARYLIQYAVIIIATLPILVIFPFFQKRLEQGMALGAVKE